MDKVTIYRLEYDVKSKETKESVYNDCSCCSFEPKDNPQTGEDYNRYIIENNVDRIIEIIKTMGLTNNNTYGDTTSITPYIYYLDGQREEAKIQLRSDLFEIADKNEQYHKEKSLYFNDIKKGLLE